MADLSKPLNIRSWILLLILAGVFLYAGISKILDPKGLVTAIETYRILPYSLSVLLALWLPWVEILSALALLHHRTRPGALLLSSGLYLLFLFGILQAWTRGLNIQCGCFGSDASGETSFYLLLVARDMVLLGMALWLLKNCFKGPKLDKFKLPA